MLLAEKAVTKARFTVLIIIEITADASYFAETGNDLQPDGIVTAGAADAIFLGAIGLSEIRPTDGTEISPHLRLRDRYQRYAGVRPVEVCPLAASLNARMMLDYLAEKPDQPADEDAAMVLDAAI